MAQAQDAQPERTFPRGASLGLLDALLEHRGVAEEALALDGAPTALAAAPPEAITEAVVAVLLRTLDAAEANVSARRSAAQALGRLPEARLPADAWTRLLGIAVHTAADQSLRQSAMWALGRLPEARLPADAWTRLLDIAIEPGSTRFVRRSAVEALGRLPEARLPADAWTRLLGIAVEPGADQLLRQSAVEALGRLPEARLPADAWTRLLDIAVEPGADRFLRQSAVEALGRLPEARLPADALSGFLRFLAIERGSYQSQSVLRILGVDGRTGAAASRLVLETGTGFQNDRAYWRALAHIAGGGQAEAQTLLSLLDQPLEPPPAPIAAVQADPDKAAALLGFLRKYQPPPNTRLATEVGIRVRQAIKLACGNRPAGRPADETGWWQDLVRRLPLQPTARPCWTFEQRRLVADLTTQMPPGADRLWIERHLNARIDTGWWTLLANLGTAVGGLAALIWALLLLRFPTSRRVQALFLFSPRARAVLSAGLFPLALTVLPGLRRWLLSPFHERLLASAHLDQFAAADWFPHSELRDRRSKAVTEAPEAMPRLDNFLVLQGEPGLGKTMLLRWLASRHRGPLAFVNARDCEAGVPTALAAMIHDFGAGEAPDAERLRLLRNLIYTRDLAVLIDGLNEVSVTTRETILAFCRDLPKAAIAVATQPLDWTPPDSARWLEILPLDRHRIGAFLDHRAGQLPADRPVRGAAFEAAAKSWLAASLDGLATKEERGSALLLLSNPFDLTFAADLLSRGKRPTIGELIEQAFDLAAADYEVLHKRPFPERRMAALAFARRLADRNDIQQDEARDEVGPLTTYRLLRSWEDSRDGKRHVEWRFRHDRVWNFFLYQHFEMQAEGEPEGQQLSARRKMLEEYESDARFRGVYLLIAEKAPSDQRDWVRELVLRRGVERQDHSLLDAYVRLFEATRTTKRSPRPSRKRTTERAEATE